MNKVFAGVVVGLALGAASAVSALDMSVGGGGHFAGDFGGGILSLSMKSDALKREQTMTTPWLGGGFGVFFDATYAEVGLGLTFVGGTFETIYKENDVERPNSNDKERAISGTSLNINVMGKFPIAVGDAMTIFPTVGIDYALCLAASSTYDGETEKFEDQFKDDSVKYTNGDLSQLWIKFGLGMDYTLSGNLFIRPQLLYGIGFANKYVSDNVKETKDRYAGNGSDITVESVLSHGLSVKVAIGYKL